MAGSEVSWQENKSLAARHGHMLDTGLLSDVTFVVAPSGEEIQAHRYTLVTCSPVFEAMFCGGLEQEAGSRVEIVGIPAEGCACAGDERGVWSRGEEINTYNCTYLVTYGL